MDVFEKYLDLAHEAGGSARRACITLTVASVMLFSCIWNSRESSWENSFIYSAGMTVQWQKLDAPSRMRAPKDLEMRIVAERFIAAFGRISTARLEQAISDIQERQVDHSVYFSLPFFGVAFHMNDLAVIGGASLLLILLWLYRALVAYDVSLEMMLEVAAGDEKLKKLARLSAQSVLPLVRSTFGSRHKSSTVFVRGLCFLSCSLLMYVLLHDYESRPLAIALNRVYAETLLWFSVGLGLAALCVALACWRVVGTTARRVSV